ERLCALQYSRYSSNACPSVTFFGTKWFFQVPCMGAEQRRSSDRYICDFRNTAIDRPGVSDFDSEHQHYRFCCELGIYAGQRQSTVADSSGSVADESGGRHTRAKVL